MKGDEAGYLKMPLPPEWRARVNLLGTILSGTKSRLPPDIPLVLIFAPFEPLVIGSRSRSKDVSETGSEFRRALAEVASKAGAAFVDTTPSFASLRRPKTGYFPVNGHPNAVGHGVIASDLVLSLIESPIALCSR